MAELVHDAGLCDLTARDLASALAFGRVSATEVLEAHLRRIDERNGALTAVVSLDPDGARQRARAADDARSAGHPLGPLHGVPMTLKDGNDVAGLRTTIGTHELDDVPSADGTVAKRLRAAGANMVGHTNKIIAAWERFFDRYDALLMPPAATVAYPHSDGRTPLEVDGGRMPYQEQGLVFALSNLNGLPGLVMPAGLGP